MPLFRRKSSTAISYQSSLQRYPRRWPSQVHVSPPIGRRVPKPVRDRREEPWLPIILRESNLGPHRSATCPNTEQPATVILAAGARKFEPIKILHGAVAKPACKPQQVIAAMRPGPPRSEAVRDRASKPGRSAAGKRGRKWACRQQVSSCEPWCHFHPRQELFQAVLLQQFCLARTTNMRDAR